MKAVVMESENGRSVVLTEDGVFRDIKGTYETGRIIDYDIWADVWAARKAKIRRIAAAACLVIAITAGAFSVMDHSAYATVDLDGYSVRYLLDEDMKIIDVEATGENGRDLADRLGSEGVKGKDINEAISMTENLTGHKYDASEEPPEVSCKNNHAGEELKNDIREHHSENDKATNIPKELPETRAENSAANDTVGSADPNHRISGSGEHDRKPAASETDNGERNHETMKSEHAQEPEKSDARGMRRDPAQTGTASEPAGPKPEGIQGP